VNRRSLIAEPPPAAGGVAPAADAAPAGAGAGGDPLHSLRDRIAAEGPERRPWWRPRLASPALWLLDEPLLFGAVLVAVLLLGLALGARLFHSSDERQLIVPTVVVQTNPPLAPAAPPLRTVPPAPAATEAPTVAATPAAATRPVAPAPAASAAPRQAAATPAPADVPPPAAGSSLSNLVNGAARQPAPAGVPAQAGVPPPAAGYAPAAASGGARTAAGAAAAGGAATTSEPPDLDAALRTVAAQGQRAATAAAERGPLPTVAPLRPVPAQPTPQP